MRVSVCHLADTVWDDTLLWSARAVAQVGIGIYQSRRGRRLLGEHNAGTTMI